MLLLYGKSADFGFVLADDDKNVYQNPHMVHSLGTDLREVWQEPYLELYIPVTYTVWRLLAAVSPKWEPKGEFGGAERPAWAQAPSPRLFHVTNVLVHGLSVGAACLLYRLLGIPWLLAWLGAMLFGVHPLQVEPVAWVTGLKDLLSGLLALLGACAYLASRRRVGALWILGLLAFTGALLAKPGLVAMPVALGLLEVAHLKRSPRGAMLALAPWLIVAAAVSAVTWWVQGRAPVDSTAATALWQRPFVALDALSFYLRKVALPVGLAVDYGRVPKLAVTLPYVISTLGTLLVVAGTLFGLRRSKAALCGLAAFALLLAPNLGFVPFVFQKVSTVADRYTHLPLLGIMFAVVATVDALPRWRRPATACLIVLGLAWTGLAWRASDAWASNHALFTETLAVNPHSFIAHNNLGQAYLNEGRDGEAATEYLAALAVKEDPHVHYNCASAFAELHQDAAALRHLERAVEMDPNTAAYHAGLAAILRDNGRAAEAAYHEAAAMRLTQAPR